MIDCAAGSANSYTESLAGMSEKIGQLQDRESLRMIVETLVHTAKEMELSNTKLEERFSASRREILDLHANLDAVRSESLTDPLTQLANRKFFDTTLEAAIAGARAKREPLSLLLTDIDHFKKFNDSFGHLTGDQVLRLVAMSVKQNVKGQDTAARYGGEEFAVILPNTALRSAITLADHIRRAVMTKELMKRSTGEHLGRVTISVGVATLHKTDTAQSLIERTDGCLYAAKRQGRNRVICESDPEVIAGGTRDAGGLGPTAFSRDFSAPRLRLGRGLALSGGERALRPLREVVGVVIEPVRQPPIGHDRPFAGLGAVLRTGRSLRARNPAPSPHPPSG